VISKYITPVLAVIVGMLASFGLQEAGIESLWAKVTGVVVAIVAIVAFFVIGYIRASRA
jgi:fumarate reductase subunit D